jgi:hypothetical protein
LTELTFQIGGRRGFANKIHLQERNILIREPTFDSPFNKVDELPSVVEETPSTVVESLPIENAESVSHTPTNNDDAAAETLPQGSEQGESISQNPSLPLPPTPASAEITTELLSSMVSLVSLNPEQLAGAHATQVHSSPEDMEFNRIKTTYANMNGDFAPEALASSFLSATPALEPTSLLFSSSVLTASVASIENSVEREHEVVDGTTIFFDAKPPSAENISSKTADFIRPTMAADLNLSIAVTKSQDDLEAGKAVSPNDAKTDTPAIDLADHSVIQPSSSLDYQASASKVEMDLPKATAEVEKTSAQSFNEAPSTSPPSNPGMPSAAQPVIEASQIDEQPKTETVEMNKQKKEEDIVIVTVELDNHANDEEVVTEQAVTEQAIVEEEEKVPEPVEENKLEEEAMVLDEEEILIDDDSENEIEEEKKEEEKKEEQEETEENASTEEKKKEEIEEDRRKEEKKEEERLSIEERKRIIQEELAKLNAEKEQETLNKQEVVLELKLDFDKKEKSESVEPLKVEDTKPPAEDENTQQNDKQSEPTTQQLKEDKESESVTEHKKEDNDKETTTTTAVKEQKEEKDKETEAESTEKEFVETDLLTENSSLKIAESSDNQTEMNKEELSVTEKPENGNQAEEPKVEEKPETVTTESPGFFGSLFGNSEPEVVPPTVTESTPTFEEAAPTVEIPAVTELPHLDFEHQPNFNSDTEIKFYEPGQVPENFGALSSFEETRGSEHGHAQNAENPGLGKKEDLVVGLHEHFSKLFFFIFSAKKRFLSFCYSLFNELSNENRTKTLQMLAMTNYFF